MSKVHKNNKGVNIQEKNSAHKSVDPGFDFDAFRLDPGLQDELEKKGLVGRFVSTKVMEQFGGQHPKGWRPYKREQNSSSVDFFFGKDPDGYTRRGDLVLAVKTKEDVSKHRAYLAQEASAMSVSRKLQRGKDEFKNFVRDSGMEEYVSVKDTYED